MENIKSDKQIKTYEKIKKILLESEKPSKELIQMIQDGKFDTPPFSMITDLKKLEQNPVFHKEGNVFNHTMLVVDKASFLKEKSENKLVFMLSALLHDLGKLTKTKVRDNGKITSHGHDKASSKIAEQFLSGFENDEVIERVSKLTRYHMQSLYFQRELNLFDLKGIIKNVEINDLFLLSVADRTGRLGVDEDDEISKLNKFKKYLEDSSKK